MKNLLFVLLAITPALIFAQASPEVGRENSTRPPSVEPVVQFANTITKGELERHLSILASDEFEGRETGTEGQKKAANYIADIFKGYDLPAIGDNNSHFQEISFLAEYWTQIGLSVAGEKSRHLWDFYSIPATNSNRDSISYDEILFLGFGIEDENYSDYEGVDVSGKAILIYDGEPFGNDKTSLITGTEEPSEWSSDFRKKLRLAKEKGASTVIIIDRDFKKNLAEVRRYIMNTRMDLGHSENPEENYPNNIHVSTSLAKKIIGKNFKKVVKARKKIEKKGKAKNVSIATDLTLYQKKRVRQLLGQNVLGYIEGVDEKLKDEVVVITAHYDHLGKRGDAVYNGADDNGSGTSSVLEVCQAFVEAKKQGVGPKRSVLVMLVSGEEKGLLGSYYYSENPIFPLKNTVANVNVDMVGRVDEKHADNANYIYVIGSDRLSTELHEINETANQTYTKLELDYTYNAENDPNRYYYRSDHYNFAQKGIPAIFYFNGTHKDYHRTSDTVDKINFDKMETIARLVFHTSWELANRDKRIVVDVVGKN